MTTDERLDRLAERHEALTQSVELLLQAQKENEARFSAITKTFEVCLDSIKRLEVIATAHEHRLDDHEGRLDDLEK